MAENEGSEKTQRATPKRLEEARKKGQVPRSADLSAAIVSLIGRASCRERVYVLV